MSNGELSVIALALLGCAQNPGIALEKKNAVYNAAVLYLKIKAHYNGAQEPDGVEAKLAKATIEHIKTLIPGPEDLKDESVAEQTANELIKYLAGYRDHDLAAA